MKSSEIEKERVFVVAEVIEYVSNSIVTDVLLKKVTGVVSILAVELGKSIPERTSPFDMLIHVIDGEAEVIIENKSTRVEVGQAIIIPAHARNSITARTRIKFLSTIIKSGYEEIA